VLPEKRRNVGAPKDYIGEWRVLGVSDVTYMPMGRGGPGREGKQGDARLKTSAARRKTRHQARKP